MKKSIFILFLFAIISSSYSQNNAAFIDNNSIQYSEKQLVFFLDSVAKLSADDLMKEVSKKSDSIFNNQTNINKPISKSNLNKLMQAIENREIDIETAKQIFGKNNLNPLLLNEESVMITSYFFDKNKNNLNEFAIFLNGSNDIFFIKSNKIITKHHINTQFVPELNYFKDQDQKTIVYYDYEFMSGSGIWQSNYFFYKINGKKILPILNQIHKSNLSNSWGKRNFLIENTIEKTNPLTLKIKYNNSFSSNEKELNFINDTINIIYVWDKKDQKLKGNFKQSKINEAQLFSYYLENSDLLFIQANHSILKNNLLDDKLKEATLEYLNETKNQFTK